MTLAFSTRSDETVPRWWCRVPHGAWCRRLRRNVGEETRLTEIGDTGPAERRQRRFRERGAGAQVERRPTGPGRDRGSQRDGIAGRQRGERGPAAHRPRLRRQPERIAVGSDCVPAGPGIADPAGRRPRRPLRAAEDVPDRHRLVRRRVADLRGGTEHRGSDRRPGSSKGSEPPSSPRGASPSCRRAFARTTARRRSGPGPRSGVPPARSDRSWAVGWSTGRAGDGRSCSTCPWQPWSWRFRSEPFPSRVICMQPGGSTTSVPALRWSPSAPRPGR